MVLVPLLFFSCLCDKNYEYASIKTGKIPDNFSFETVFKENIFLHLFSFFGLGFSLTFKGKLDNLGEAKDFG